MAIHVPQFPYWTDKQVQSTLKTPRGKAPVFGLPSTPHNPPYATQLHTRNFQTLETYIMAFVLIIPSLENHVSLWPNLHNYAYQSQHLMNIHCDYTFLLPDKVLVCWQWGSGMQPWGLQEPL